MVEHSLFLKHTTTLLYLSDHYILSREWETIVDQVQTDYHGRPMVLCVTELLIMREPHYGRICFKSVKTLGALHSSLWKKSRPSASTLSTAKNVELLGVYPILLCEHRPVGVCSIFGPKNKCYEVITLRSISYFFLIFTLNLLSPHDALKHHLTSCNQGF